MINEEKYQKTKSFVIPIDLCKYRSLRIPSICFGIIFVGSDFVAYCYSSMGDKIAFNTVINGYGMGLSSLVAIPFVFIFANSIPRKLSGKITYSLIFILNLIATFILRPDLC